VAIAMDLLALYQLGVTIIWGTVKNIWFYNIVLHLFTLGLGEHTFTIHAEDTAHK
jgi:hypothetical protein